jgi:anti-sigma factor RsiW
VSGAHLDDALSALVDGGLSQAEEGTARAHLASCEMCRAELETIEAARSLVRSLPELELPPGVVERVRRVGSSRRRPPRVAALAAAAVAAAASILFAAAVPSSQPVTPKVGRLVEVHATSGVNGDPLSRLTPAAVPVSFEER